MTARRIQSVWVGRPDRWRRWVKLPLFASTTWDGQARVEGATNEGVYRTEAAPWAARDVAWLVGERAAFLIDLPGAEAVELALVLGAAGVRPVVSINAASADGEVVDMRPVLDRLAEGARFRASFPTDRDAAPAFVLDARRDGRGARIEPGAFDNRWAVFANDLPSAADLDDAHVRVVVIVQDGAEPKDDVRAIAWAYRRGGLDVRIADVRKRTIVAMPGRPQGWLSFFADQVRRRFVLRRRWDGSYGRRVPTKP